MPRASAALAAAAAGAACGAESFRDAARDHPSLRTAQNNCSALPQETCFANPNGKIRVVKNVSTDPGDCCVACWAEETCASWCHFHGSGGTWACNLYSDVGPTKQTDDGCSAGVARAAPSPAPPAPRGDKPNIVFIVVESTDGRTWSPGYQNDVIPLPNLRRLQAGGLEFRMHYSNAPVCCPSRASFWSGRHASNIPHDHNGVAVGGAWNNYEGLPKGYSDRIDQVMSRLTDYNVKVSGKTDWSTGGHSENVYLNAWTMYTQFPYSVNQTGGWSDETHDCGGNGSVRSGGGAKTGTPHSGDWGTADKTTAWIKQVAGPEKPFFVFQGMNIVHPPYASNEYWSSKIDREKVDVPAWRPLAELHPCDFQSSMLKRCTPSDADAPGFYDVSRRRNIRALYYAMIAEFDAMVGQYMTTVEDAGVWNQTAWIVTSDHGDMQMEKQQFYKMVPYDASARVPMVIFDGRPGRQFPAGKVVRAPTQLADIFPTVMDLAGVDPAQWPGGLDGSSLAPLMPGAAAAAAPRPGFVVSQFHGDNIAMSWFLIVKATGGTTYKLIVWGTGKEVPSLLFDLIADPSEESNLVATAAGQEQHAALVAELESDMRSVVDYPAVAQSVAQYGKDMFAVWVNQTKGWRDEIHKKGLRWTPSWDADADGSIAAVDAWMSEPAVVKACRGNLTWPAV